MQAHLGSCGVGLFAGELSSDNCDVLRWWLSASTTCTAQIRASARELLAPASLGLMKILPV